MRWKLLISSCQVEVKPEINNTVFLLITKKFWMWKIIEYKDGCSHLNSLSFWLRIFVRLTVTYWSLNDKCTEKPISNKGCFALDLKCELLNEKFWNKKYEVLCVFVIQKSSNNCSSWIIKSHGPSAPWSTLRTESTSIEWICVVSNSTDRQENGICHTFDLWL